MKAFAGVCLVLVGALVGCGNGKSDPDPPTVLELSGAGYALEFDLTRGRFDVTGRDGQLVLDGAFCEVALKVEDQIEPDVYRCSGRYRTAGQIETGSDALGGYERALVTFSGHEQGGPDLRLELSVYEDRPFFTARLEVTNTTGADIVLDRLVPAKVDAENRSALWLGSQPAGLRILEAGSYLVFDFFVDIKPGDVAESVETVGLGFIHGQQEGHSISNWNHAIRDVASGQTFVAGALDFDHASPMCNTSYDPQIAEPEGGRTPLTYWSVEFPYLPSGKPLSPGEVFAAGPVWVAPDEADAHATLEAYAQAVADHNGVDLWPDRGPEHRMPTGWNSWTGSGSSGGYGSGIDEQLMLDNLAAMDEEFTDFGGEWFQIDDGYEYHYGDWDWREDRFPHGSAWMADQIEAAGLIPGLWIAFFQLSRDSRLYADHQDDGWFPPTIPGVGGDSPVLDLTHPDVQAWVTDRARRIRADGYRWLKTDFCYYALGAAEFHDPTATREEAYRMGLQAVQAGLDQGAAEAGGQPGDTFWLSVSMLGPHVGYADSIRPNLDTMPAWDAEDPGAGRMMGQGFKPTVRSIARRYYMHDRVYVFNHDLMYFRSHPDESVPRITADESRCLLTAVGLSGSVAKLGEKIVEMQPGWINDYRRVIPVYGVSARPLDLFEREVAEIWHLRVVPEQGLNTRGAGPAYDVLALFNWGTNADLTTNPYTPMADEARVVGWDLAAAGMDPGQTYVAREFWSGEVLDPVSGELTREVQPHTVQVWALRPKLDRPQFLGDNRHFLQGAVEVFGIAWDADAGSLRVDYDAAPGSTKAPFVHQLDFRAPAGWTLTDTRVPGARDGSLVVEQSGEIISIRFAVDARQTVPVSLTFDAP